MASKLDICNMALSHLGAAAVTAIPDGSREGTALDRHAEPVRQEFVASHPWPWARRLVTLAADVTAPPAPWAGRYQSPADLLRVVSVADGVAWQAYSDGSSATTWLYADTLDGIDLDYLQDLDWTRIPAPALPALAWKIAAAVAMEITESADRAKLAAMQAADHERRARFNFAQHTKRPTFTIAPAWDFSGVGGGAARVGGSGAGSGGSIETASAVRLSAGALATLALACASDSDTGLYWPAADTLALVAAGAEVLRVAAAQAQLVAGTVGAPALAFTADPDTGVYRAAADTLGLVAGGSEALRASAAQLLAGMAGTAGAPAFARVGDTDTGLFFPAGDALAWALGGVERARLTATGLGLGATPACALHLGATDALKLVAGTTAQRPGSPLAGMLRWNTTTSRLEIYTGAAWVDLSPVFTQSFASAEIAVAGGAQSVSAAHGLGATPKLVRAVLVCKTAEANYAVNDEAECFGNDTSGGAQQTVFADATNIGLAIASTPRVANKTTGAQVLITAASWKIKLYAWT